MLGRVGIEDVVQRLQIEAHALDLVVHQPVGALDGHAGGVHEVVVVLAQRWFMPVQMRTQSPSWMPPSTLAAAFSMSQR